MQSRRRALISPFITDSKTEIDRISVVHFILDYVTIRISVNQHDTDYRQYLEIEILYCMMTYRGH